MGSRAEYIDPADVAGVNERIRAWAADGEVIHPVGINHLIIAEDAIDSLVDLARSLSKGGPTMLVVDRTPIMRGGENLKELLEESLERSGPLTVYRLGDDSARPFEAKIDSARRLAGELHDYAAVVSVGSGSVTDVVKYARQLAAGGNASKTGSGLPNGTPPSAPSRTALPMISFPTAASVTAYTSALAVLTIDGVKRTLPARAPDAVVCDLRTLMDAPKAMTLAGFGDVLARSVAGGDWFIAGQLGMDPGFSFVPGRLLEGAEREMIDRAEQVAKADLGGVRCVLDGLLLGGMAMSIVNQTAPLSGWEHVISHFLDLTAHAELRLPALHGSQVGVGTLVSARAYEQAWPILDLDRVCADADLPAHQRIIEKEFRRYDPTGRLTAEIWGDLKRKLERWNRSADVRRVFADRKKAGEFEPLMQANVRSSHLVSEALSRATAPRQFTELDPPVPAPIARAAVLHGHLIRARFTLGDLLYHAGWLGEGEAGLRGLTGWAEDTEPDNGRTRFSGS